MRLLELRALVSLARFHATRGEGAKSVRILAPMRPFVEGATGLAAAAEARALLARSTVGPIDGGPLMAGP